LRQHLPKAVGILTIGLAIWLVAEIAKLTLGLDFPVSNLITAIGL
jgi:hypothetical protein